MKEKDPRTEARSKGLLIAIPPQKIALFKAIIESYDNLATLRTEDPRRHILKLYFSAECEDEVRGLIESLREKFEIREIEG